MATLAQITGEARIGIKIITVVLVLAFIVFIGTGGYRLVQRMFFPAPPPGPEQKFGGIPSPNFPESRGNTPIDYRINTISGFLPAFSEHNGIINVYKFVQPFANLLALSSARNSVASLGFTQDEKKISGNLYSWTNNKSSVITYDILSHNFSVESSLSNALSETSSVITKNIVGDTVELLSSLGVALDDINTEKTRITFYTISDSSLIRVDNQQQAKVARIDFFQNDVAGLPIFYDNPDESIINVTLTWELGQAKIIQGSVNHNTVDNKTFSTYPLKTTEQAFEDLKNGSSYFTNNGATETIDLKDVKFGYYIGKDQEYLLPVYIFLGDDFTGYIPAVAGKVSNPTP